MAFVDPDIVGEHIVPEMAAEFLHALAAPDQAAVDEMIGPADLVQDRQVPQRFGPAHSPAFQQRQRLVGKDAFDALERL
jgi:hypothetical protein